MKKITPFIWIKENGKAALDFYTTLFADSKIVSITPIEGAPGPAGQFVASFELMGESFMLLQGGDNPILSTAGPLSLVVPCDSQTEIDKLWAAFKDGGKEIACGWITDKFGVTWQVVPATMGELMSGDPEKARRVSTVMMKMMKLDIAELERAAQG